MRRKQVAPAPNLRKLDTLTLANGKTLEQGEEFTVKGEGRFTFH